MLGGRAGPVARPRRKVCDLRRHPRTAPSSWLSDPVGTVGVVLFARCCAACGSPDGPLCAGCLATLRPAPPADPPPGLASLDALLRYEDAARTLVLAAKYGNARPVLARLARAMAALVADHPLAVVTWAPTTPARRRERGYDQAEVLARGVARTLRLPCRGLLVRSPGRAQTGLDRAERLAGVRFVARRPVAGPVLVVDDVCTTGATLAAAGRGLHGAGAEVVRALTAAVTPVASPRNVLKATTVTAEDGREGLVDPHGEKRIVHATD